MNADPEDRSNGYITWVGDGREAWTLRQSAVGPNPRVGLGTRIIPEEPMAMVSFLILILILILVPFSVPQSMSTSTSPLQSR